jgi:hypothetical protein
MENSWQISLNNINVFLAADKFAIPPLKSLAEHKFLDWGDANAHSPVIPKVARDVMAMIPGHETKFQDVVLAAIYMYIEKHVENPEILEVFTAFGDLGSLIIEMLVVNGRAKPMIKLDHIEDLAAAFSSIRSSEEPSQ